MSNNCYNKKCTYRQKDNSCMKNQHPQQCENAIVSKDGRIHSRAYYIKVLSSAECACKKYKKRGHAFCWGDCWRQLPDYLKIPLRNKIGQGFEKAYENAFQWLMENVWR